jgi:hypothetical protein
MMADAESGGEAPAKARSEPGMATVSAPEPGLQRCPNVRPLAVDDAVVGGVAHPAVGHDHVIAEDPFEPGADAQQRRSRRLVEGVGLELHPPAAEGVERVAQHQELGLAVGARSLERLGHPCPADLEPAMLEHDVHVAAGSDRAAGGAVDRGEWQLRAGLATRDRTLGPLAEFSFGCGAGERPAPDAWLEGDLGKGRDVVERERFEADDRTFEGHGFETRSRRCGHRRMVAGRRRAAARVGTGFER